MTTAPTPDELAALLRSWASGLSSTTAAVELLIAHESWMRRRDWITTCVEIPDRRERLDPDQPMAAIDWIRTIAALDDGGLPASTSMASVLRLAASLAGGHPVDLGDALLGLDATNAYLVTVAVVAATQQQDRVSVALEPRDLPPWTIGATAP